MTAHLAAILCQQLADLFGGQSSQAGSSVIGTLRSVGRTSAQAQAAVTLMAVCQIDLAVKQTGHGL
jgi:hypothetical protein